MIRDKIQNDVVEAKNEMIFIRTLPLEAVPCFVL